jgi:hypothetical protein
MKTTILIAGMIPIVHLPVHSQQSKDQPCDQGGQIEVKEVARISHVNARFGLVNYRVRSGQVDNCEFACASSPALRNLPLIAHGTHGWPW